jgi:lysophospholipase L1-like esterase
MLINRIRARTRSCIGFTVVLATSLSGCGDDDTAAVTSTVTVTVTAAPDAPATTLASTAAPVQATAARAPTTTLPEDGSLHLVGLGDSIIGAGGATTDSILGQLAASITSTSGRQVVVTNLGDGSNTSGALLERLRHAQDHRNAVAAADIVVVIVGGNDGDPFGNYPPGTCAPEQPPSECLAAYAPGLAANLDAILGEIEVLRTGHPTAIRVGSPDYNPFVGWSEAPSPSYGADFYTQVAAALTAAACEAASAHGAQCVDVFHAFNGPNGTDDAAQFLASDHAHPGPAGVRRIADEIARVGFPELGI